MTNDLIKRLEDRQGLDIGWHESALNHIDKLNEDRLEAAIALRSKDAEIAKLREALEPFAAAPEYGLHGGPMVQAVLTYEDGTDENTARHRGKIDPSNFRRARTALGGGNE